METKEQELTVEQISEIRHTLANKAYNAAMGIKPEGMEILHTQEEGIFVLRDNETGVQLGMNYKKELGNVIVKMSFFEID